MVSRQHLLGGFTLPKTIDVIESALISEFLRIPYAENGRSVNGANCWYTIMLWYERRLGVRLIDFESDYMKAKVNGEVVLADRYCEYFDKVDEPDTNDIVILSLCDGELHGGIYLRDNRFLHTCRAGTVVNKLTSELWRDKIEGFYRYNAK